MKYNFYKWRVWSILASAFIISLFNRGAVGVISEHLLSDLNITATELSNIASITFYTYAFMQIPAGIILDFFGYKKISFYGVFITGVGSIFLGISSNVYMAYGGRFLVGLGTSVIFISVLKAQRIWFQKEKFTKASGLLSFIGNLGGVFATFPLAALVILLGWRNSMIFMGVISIIISLLILFYVKNSPRDYGYEPMGVEQGSEKFNINKAIKEVVSMRATWKNFLILFTLVGCTTTLTGLWGVSYIMKIYEIETTKASFYVAFIVYGLICGSLFVDKACEIFENNIVMYPRIAAVVNSCLWIYMLLIRKGYPSLMELAIIFFIMGFFAMSHIIAFTDINEHCKEKNSGLASSIVNSGEFIGSSLISIIIGIILDLGWNGQAIEGIRIYTKSQYIYSFYVFLIISILGIVATFISDGAKSDLK